MKEYVENIKKYKENMKKYVEDIFFMTPLSPPLYRRLDLEKIRTFRLLRIKPVGGAPSEVRCEVLLFSLSPLYRLWDLEKLQAYP